MPDISWFACIVGVVSIITACVIFDTILDWLYLTNQKHAIHMVPTQDE